MAFFEPFKASDEFTMANFNSKLGGGFNAVSQEMDALSTQVEAANPIVKLKEVTLASDETILNVDLSDVDLTKYKQLMAYCAIKQNGDGITGLRFNDISTKNDYRFAYLSSGSDNQGTYINLLNWDVQYYTLNIYQSEDVIFARVGGYEWLTSNYGSATSGCYGLCKSVKYNQLTSFSIGLYAQQSGSGIGTIAAGSKIVLYGLKYGF